jgi:adenine-specific DNA-methyltransferase
VATKSKRISRRAAGAKNGGPANPADPTKTYSHPTETAPLRPDIGTQAQFRKRKQPAKYSYDSSLAPVLDWDGQNYAREQGERLIREIL